MSCEDFIENQRPRFEHWFYLGKILTDPTTVKFIYKRPSDVSPTPLTYGLDAAVIKVDTGNYYVDLLLDDPGLWTWRWESSGIVDDADQGEFNVVAENPVG